MHFSFTLDGNPTRNPVARDEGWLYVQVPVLADTNGYRHYQPVTFTANYSDSEKIIPFRWRFINDKIVTTMEKDGETVVMPIENHLLDRSRTEVIPHVNGDPLDVRRFNLASPRVRQHSVSNVPVPPQEVTVKGTEAFLTLKSGQVVTLDRDMAPIIKPYRWFVDNSSKVSIRAVHMTEAGTTTTLTLHRMILNDPESKRRMVIFKNGDRFDLRRDNLCYKDS